MGKYDALPKFVTDIPDVNKLSGAKKIAFEVWCNLGRPIEGNESEKLMIEVCIARIKQRISDKLLSKRSRSKVHRDQRGNHIWRRHIEEES